MEIITPRKTSVFNRLGGIGQPQVCRYWLAGNCKRNPCRFPHRLPPDDTCSKKSRNMTWRNPNNHLPSKSSTSSIQGGTVNSRINQETATAALSSSVLTSERDARVARPGYTKLAKLEGHKKDITGISLPSDSYKLYSSSKDGTIGVWDCNSGQSAGYVEIHGEVGCLASEGPWLFAGLTNAVKMWNLQSQTEYTLGGGPIGLVCSIVMDDDNLFVGSEDGSILVWKWKPGNEIPVPATMLKEHNGGVCSLIIGAGRLYSGSRDSTIKVWDLQSLQCLQTLHGHTRDVTSVLCWDKYLLSSSLDNTIKVWEGTEDGKVELIYETKEDSGVTALRGIHDSEAKPILPAPLVTKLCASTTCPRLRKGAEYFRSMMCKQFKSACRDSFFIGDATGELSVWKLDAAQSTPAA